MVYRINLELPNSIVPTDSWKKNPKSLERIFDVKVPQLTKDSKVLALGSCFAEHIVNALRNEEIDVDGPANFIFYDDRITTSIAMKEHFEWCCAEEKMSPMTLYSYPGKVSSGKGVENLAASQHVELAKKYSLETLEKATLVILTLGLSEVWYDENSNSSVWKWPGKSTAKSLKFKLLSAQENYENIAKIVELIRSKNTSCSIVFTLSPVPLMATFRTDYNINISNCASKARLRAGLDQFFFENKDENIFYWPSYEYVTQTSDVWEPDEQHVKVDVIQQIMNHFLKKSGLK